MTKSRLWTNWELEEIKTERPRAVLIGLLFVAVSNDE